MIQRIFNSKTQNFTSAAFLIAISTILSGLLGLLRDRLLAGAFGAGSTLDVYFIAFRIPDLVQAVLVAGGISATFLPIFSEEMRKSKEKAFAFANNLLNCSALLLIIVCFLLFIFTPWILHLITPGFSLSQKTEAMLLTRIMLLSPILFGLSAIFSGMLQYFDHFLAYSLAPILYNIGIISGILFLTPKFGVYGLGMGVVLGALLHFLIQIPIARRIGYCYQKLLDLKNYRLRKVIALMLPCSISFAFIQLNLTAMAALASSLAPGTIAVFNFAKNLQGLPVSFIGMPFAIAIFPALSRAWALSEKEKFQNDFFSALGQIFFLVFPLGLLIFILRAQIVRLVLGTGLWGWRETRLTAACLGIFSVSIFALALIAFFRKSFYSVQKMRSLIFIDGLAFFLNIGFSLLFLTVLRSDESFINALSSFLKLEGVEDIRLIAFPLALSCSAIFQASLLFFLFIKKTGLQIKGQFFSSLKKIFLLTVLMGIGVWAVLRPLAIVFPMDAFWGVFFQTFFASLLGIFIYSVIAFHLKFPEFQALKSLVSKGIGAWRREPRR